MPVPNHTILPLADILRLGPEWRDQERGQSDAYLAVAEQAHLLRWCAEVPAYLTQRQSGRDNTSPLLAAAEEINPLFWPLANDVIEHLLIAQSFELLEDVPKFLDEAERVLTASGFVLFILPYRRRFFPLPARFAFRAASGMPIRFHRYDLIHMIKEAGFDIVDIRASSARKGQAGGKDSLPKRVVRAWSHQEGLLIIRARKRLYAPVKANYASRKKRLTLGRIFPAGASAMK